MVPTQALNSFSHSPVVIGAVYDDHCKMLMNHTSQVIIDLQNGRSEESGSPGQFFCGALVACFTSARFSKNRLGGW